MKKIIALALSLLLVFSCVQGVLAEGTEPVTIRVWSNDAHSKPVFTDFVEKFNNGPGKELGIIIELQVYGTDYYSVLDVTLQSPDTSSQPHIFKCNKIPQYARSGQLACLEDLPGGEALIAPYKEKNSEGVGLVDGKTYALPFKATTVGLAYNMEMFEKLKDMPAGEERDELVRITANQMKRDLAAWGHGSMDDEKVADDLARFTDGKIQLDLQSFRFERVAPYAQNEGKKGKRKK